MKEGQQRLPDSQQEKGVSSSQPAPMTVPVDTGTGRGDNREPVTKNDKG